MNYSDLLFCIVHVYHYGNSFADKAILNSHVIMSYLLERELGLWLRAGSGDVKLDVDVSKKATSIAVLSEKNGLGGRSKWKTKQTS